MNLNSFLQTVFCTPVVRLAKKHSDRSVWYFLRRIVTLKWFLLIISMRNYSDRLFVSIYMFASITLYSSYNLQQIVVQYSFTSPIIKQLLKVFASFYCILSVVSEIHLSINSTINLILHFNSFILSSGKQSMSGDAL